MEHRSVSAGEQQKTLYTTNYLSVECMKYISLFYLFCASLVVCTQSTLRAQNAVTQHIGTTANAADNVPKELNDITSHFFSLIAAGDIRTAFTDLLKNSPLASNVEQVDNLVMQTRRTIELYGEFKRHEIVRANILGESLFRLHYFALHRDFPVRWVLTYYKSPVKGWVLTNIKFDDRAEEMFPDN